MIGQEADLFRAAFSQSRRVDRKHIQTVIKIASKGFVFDLLQKILVCGGDNPQVDRPRIFPANADDFLDVYKRQSLPCGSDAAEKNSGGQRR